MAETHEGLQQIREEVKIDQIIKFLQSFGVVLAENRDILSALPELIKKLETNITKATGTATSDVTREISRPTEEQEGKKKKWETQQKLQEKQISRLENELQEAKKTILDLEARNKQNDNDVEMLKRENRDLSDKNYYKSKYKDLKAKLRTTNEDLEAKKEKIAALGRELSSKQEDYDKETHRTRKELTKKEKELVEKKEELQMLRKQHSESLRDQKGKIDESEARIAELEEELRAKQEDYEKETQRSRKELAEKEEELVKVMEEMHTIKREHDESFRGQETKIDELQARVAQLEGERLSLQENFEREKQRRKQELNEKENALHKGKIERERAKQHHTDSLRDKETKLKRLEAW